MAEQNSEGGVPVTWPELIAITLETMPELLESLRETPEELATTRPPWMLANGLSLPAEILSEVATILGPEACRPFLAMLAEFLPRAIEEMSVRIRKDAQVAAIGLLSYLNVARCCGETVPADAATMEAEWLQVLAEHKRRLNENEKVTLAFAALAAKTISLVPDFIGGGRLPKRFAPGEVFQFNRQGFVRYLAVAIEREASAQEVEPAWRSFVQSFPRLYAARMIQFADLMWCARAVMAHFEKRPVETVAQAFHQMITRTS
jgi:hypothetical protein